MKLISDIADSIMLQFFAWLNKTPKKWTPVERNGLKYWQEGKPRIEGGYDSRKLLNEDSITKPGNC